MNSAHDRPISEFTNDKHYCSNLNTNHDRPISSGCANGLRDSVNLNTAHNYLISSNYKHDQHVCLESNSAHDQATFLSWEIIRMLVLL